MPSSSIESQPQQLKDMKKNYTNEDIISFVNSTMNEAEQTAFAAQMSRDEDLREEVAFYQSLSSTVQVEKVMADAFADLKDSGFFTQIEQEEKVALSNNMTTAPPQKKIVAFRQRRWLAYAAAIGLLVVTIGGLWWANSHYSNTALAATNMEELRLDLTGNLKGTNELVNAFEKGEVALQEKNYTEAIRFFETIPASDKQYNNALLYLAYAQLQAGQSEKAIPSATTLKSITNDSKKIHQADWIIVKARLQEGADTAIMIVLLDAIIANPSHSFLEEATALKEKLQSGWRGFVF